MDKSYPELVSRRNPHGTKYVAELIKKIDSGQGAPDTRKYQEKRKARAAMGGVDDLYFARLFDYAKAFHAN